jgi:hypothetical protein
LNREVLKFFVDLAGVDSLMVTSSPCTRADHIMGERNNTMTPHSLLFLSATAFWLLPSNAVLINEVSDQGTVDVCNGNDWIELSIPIEEGAPLDLAGFVLHDDNGPNDAYAYTFPSPTSLNPGDYLLLCTKTTDGPQFGIG